jgi:hypothetical protein
MEGSEMNIKVKYIVTALFFVLSFSIAHAANIYVDKSLSANCTGGSYSIRNRSCSGTDGNAYTTIKSAVTSMGRGDDVFIRGGTYNEANIVIGASASGSAQNYSSIQSYPGEWAVVDAQYSGTGTNRSVFLKSSGLSYFNFERMEITGGGASDADCTYGSGIMLYDAQYITIRFLYIHNNWSETHAGASAGIQLANGVQAPNNITIEYCYFKCNGNPFGDRNSANANLAIYSDYKYSDTVDLSKSMHNNVIQYNLFDGSCNTGSTVVAVMHKGMQRLTGWDYGEGENPSDNAPNGAQGRGYGDKIHHNIMINHSLGLRLDQDYVQAYNNIIWNVDIGESGESSYCGGIHTKDYYAARRGSYKPCIYNNTIYAARNKGIAVGTIGSNWSSTLLPGYFADTWVYNNLIDSYDDGYDWSGISIQSDESPKPAYPLERIHLSRNFFYRPDGSNLIYINTTKYTKQAIQATVAADVVWVKSSPSPYVGEFGAEKFKTNEVYALDGAYTIANGGVGGDHPYIVGIRIPSYVGAVDPKDNSWVDIVYGLSNVNNLTRGDSYIPSLPPKPPTALRIY